MGDNFGYINSNLGRKCVISRQISAPRYLPLKERRVENRSIGISMVSPTKIARRAFRKFGRHPADKTKRVPQRSVETYDGMNTAENRSRKPSALVRVLVEKSHRGSSNGGSSTERSNPVYSPLYVTSGQMSTCPRGDVMIEHSREQSWP